MLIDTHCHLDVQAFDGDLEQVWARARAAGVRAAVVPAIEPARWERTRAVALAGERFVALGIHPQALPNLSDAEVDRALAELPARLREAGAVAVGECGLDGSVDLSRAPMERQKRVLAAHVEVARTLDLPLILHVFRAHGDAAELLLRGPALPSAGAVLHSFSGGVELARAYTARGFHLSFAGAVTRPNARRPVEAARAVPLACLLLETDAPDQPPTGAPHGARGEPAHLPLTLARLAEIRSESPDELATATSTNAQALFRLQLD